MRVGVLAEEAGRAGLTTLPCMSIDCMVPAKVASLDGRGIRTADVSCGWVFTQASVVEISQDNRFSYCSSTVCDTSCK